tara:strand:- start:459 stop:722 length:264 start_codon:yes stop_codon:yes gene_type:complete
MEHLKKSLKHYLGTLPFNVEYGGYEQYDGENVFIIHYPIHREKDLITSLQTWVSATNPTLGIYKSTDDFSSHDKGYWTYIIEQQTNL